MTDDGPKSRRLDQVLVDAGHFASRTRAQGAIRQGHVAVDGRTVSKPGQLIAPESEVSVSGDVHGFVSRAALKLENGLDAFGFDPAGKICLDLGASTGGFTQSLLNRGAAKVYAIDVGTGQLHESLAGEERVINLEKTHAKTISDQNVPELVDAIVCDVSFISLKKSLPFALARASKIAFLVALIKPQFELGPAFIGKGGLVTADDSQLGALCGDMARWLEGLGWQVAGVIDSPIKGGDGNREFLIGAQRTSQ
ncbi:MAG: TlyA family RNA methyltransferase [Pseudomonadota bacterium]